MPQTKHTEGPWKPYATRNDLALVTSETGLICCGITGWRTGEDRANARLIAAAPDMLKTLQKVAKLLKSLDQNLDSVLRHVATAVKAAESTDEDLTIYDIRADRADATLSFTSVGTQSV